MIIHCNKCDINWARLGIEHVNDETYEFCPKCKSDMFLGPGTDIVAYIQCPVTGRITNVETGELIDAAPDQPYRPTKRKVWDETWEDWKLRDEAAEDVYVESGGRIPKEKIIRKHHFETI